MRSSVGRSDVCSSDMSQQVRPSHVNRNSLFTCKRLRWSGERACAIKLHVGAELLLTGQAKISGIVEAAAHGFDRYRRQFGAPNSFGQRELLPAPGHTQIIGRSEEHTSELQSLMRISYAVFCLKKKNNHTKLTSLTSHSEHKTLTDTHRSRT